MKKLGPRLRAAAVAAFAPLAHAGKLMIGMEDSIPGVDRLLPDQGKRGGTDQRTPAGARLRQPAQQRRGQPPAGHRAQKTVTPRACVQREDGCELFTCLIRQLYPALAAPHFCGIREPRM